METLKVAIIGAGIAGLATAVSLRKYAGELIELDITIYEKLDLGPARTDYTEDIVARPRLGVGLGLQHNGIATLQEIDQRAYSIAATEGLECQGFEFRTAGDSSLGRAKLPVMAMARGVLIEGLRQALPPHLIQQKSVERIIIGDGRRPRLMLEGEQEPRLFDMVIGADGIRSPTRHALFGDSKEYHSEYTGSCAVGGFHEMTVPSQLIRDPFMTFTMGPGGMVGYTAVSKTRTDKIMFWSVYKRTLPPRDGQVDLEEEMSQLRLRHASYTNPIVREVVTNATVQSVWPVFIMPILPHWGRDGVLLVGDAAHTMPPRSGQGASQGLEDALALSLLLAGNVKAGLQKADAVSKTVGDLYALRGPRIKKIRDAALESSQDVQDDREATWFQTWLMYAFMYIALTLSSLGLQVFPMTPAWDAKAEVEKYLGTGGTSL